MKKLKKAGSFALALGITLSALPGQGVFAEGLEPLPPLTENTTTDDLEYFEAVERGEILSAEEYTKKELKNMLAKDLLKDIKQMEKDGLIVEIQTTPDGYTFVNGYERGTGSPATQPGQVGIEAYAAEYNAYQRVYYGYKLTGYIKGTIYAYMYSTSVNVTSHSLRVEGASGGNTYERSEYHTDGNPATVYYNFDIVSTVGYSHTRVPYNTKYRIYPSGKMTFYNNMDCTSCY